MTFWKTHSFKALQQEWYRRLSESGFEDEEQLIGDEMLLKCRSTVPIDEVSKEEYYRTIGELVHQTPFRNEVDKFIMLKHADGWRAVDICVELQRNGHSRHRDTVRYRIRSYEHKWGVRQWSPKQLHKKVS